MRPPEPLNSRPRSRLRICLLSYRSNPHCGGQGVYLRHLGRALVDLGHRVEVVSGPPDPGLDPDIPVVRLPCLDLYNPEDPFRVPALRELADPVNLVEWLGVSTMGFPEPMTFGIRAYRYLRRRMHRYDVVHDNQSLSYGVWAISRRVPTVATIHHPVTVDRDIAVADAGSVWEKAKQLRWYSFIGMQKQVARSLDRIVTVSERARDDIGRAFRVGQDRFTVVPNGIDTDLFRPLPQIPRENNRVIVTNSADTPLKGLAFLLRAVAAIAARRPIRLVVIGEPKENGRVARLVAELGIRDRITFTGRIDGDRFVHEYARAAIAVVPSMYEGFGLPVGEAMACGVPVISTSGGALPEVVGDAGILVPPGDHEALAAAITRLLEDPELAGRLGRAGYQRVAGRFTWKNAAEKTVEAYRSAIRDHRRL